MTIAYRRYRSLHIRFDRLPKNMRAAENPLNSFTAFILLSFAFSRALAKLSYDSMLFLIAFISILNYQYKMDFKNEAYRMIPMIILGLAVRLVLETRVGFLKHYPYFNTPLIDLRSLFEVLNNHASGR